MYINKIGETMIQIVKVQLIDVSSIVIYIIVKEAISLSVQCLKLTKNVGFAYLLVCDSLCQLLK